MAQSRRIKAIRISPYAVADLLTGRVVPFGLPPEIHVERFHVEWQTNSAIIFISDESFPEVDPGQPIEAELLQVRLMPVEKIY